MLQSLLSLVLAENLLPVIFGKVAKDPTDARDLSSEKFALDTLFKQVVESSPRRYDWCGKGSSSQAVQSIKVTYQSWLFSTYRQVPTCVPMQMLRSST